VRRALLGEQDNLRAAVDWLVSQDRPELLARLTFASRQLWYNGWSEDGDRVLEPLLDDRRLEPRRLAEAHVTAGWYDFWRLRIDSMGRRASRAMELVGDPLDPLSMEATYAVWISSLSRLGYVRGRGALLAEDSTAPARSRALAVGLCESAAAAGHQRFLALGELASGVLDLLLDEEFDRSLAHFESAVAHADPDDMGFAIGHSHAATVLELQGRYDEALRHLDLARPVHAGTIFEYSSDLMEGIIRAHQGDASTAAGLLLRACTSVSGRVVNPSALIGVAVLASAVGEHARAGRLMATVVARGVPPLTFLLPYIAPAIREARAALGHDRANEVKVAGAALKLSDALQGELEWLASLAADR
jgi:tetratricopeptide (TPR) repeat protein